MPKKKPYVAKGDAAIKSLGLPKTRTKAEKKQITPVLSKKIVGAQQFAQGGSEDISSGNERVLASGSNSKKGPQVRRTFEKENKFKIKQY